MQNVFKKSASIVFQVSGGQVIIAHILDETKQLRQRVNLKENQIEVDYTVTFYHGYNAPNLTTAFALVNNPDFNDIFRGRVMNDTVGYTANYIVFLSGISLGPAVVYAVTSSPSSTPSIQPSPLSSTSSNALVLALSISLAVIGAICFCHVVFVIFGRRHKSQVAGMHSPPGCDSELDKPILALVTKRPDSPKVLLSDGTSTKPLEINVWKASPSRREDTAVVPVSEMPDLTPPLDAKTGPSYKSVEPTSSLPPSPKSLLSEKSCQSYPAFSGKSILDSKTFQRISFLDVGNETLSSKMATNTTEGVAADEILSTKGSAWNGATQEASTVGLGIARLPLREGSAVRDYISLTLPATSDQTQVLNDLEVSTKKIDAPEPTSPKNSTTKMYHLEEESVPELPLQISNFDIACESPLERTPGPMVTAWDQEINEDGSSKRAKSLKPAEATQWSIGDVVTVVGQRK